MDKPSMIDGGRDYATANGHSDNRRPTHPDYLTVEEVCRELSISRSTWDKWRANGRGPRCYKLPNAQLRIKRKDLEHWMLRCREDA